MRHGGSQDYDEDSEQFQQVRRYARVREEVERKGLTGSPRVVHVWSRQQALALIPERDSVIISIHSPDHDTPAGLMGWGDLLVVPFGDWVEDRECEDKRLLFNTRHAKMILDFAIQHQDVERIHVHCAAGVSRSVAVGEFLSEWQSRQLHLHATHTTAAANGRVRRTLWNLINGYGEEKT